MKGPLQVLSGDELVAAYFFFFFFVVVFVCMYRTLLLFPHNFKTFLPISSSREI